MYLNICSNAIQPIQELDNTRIATQIVGPAMSEFGGFLSSYEFYPTLSKPYLDT